MGAINDEERLFDPFLSSDDLQQNLPLSLLNMASLLSSVTPPLRGFTAWSRPTPLSLGGLRA